MIIFKTSNIFITLFYFFFLETESRNKNSSLISDELLYIHASKDSISKSIVQLVANLSGKCLQIQDNIDNQNGLILFGNNNLRLDGVIAVSFYLANDQLKGSSLSSQSEVLQWMFFALNQILPYACCWTNSQNSKSSENYKTSKVEVLKILEVLNNIFLNKTYLVGERITLADIAIYSTLVKLYNEYLDVNMKKKYQNLTRWFETMIPKMSKTLS